MVLLKYSLKRLIKKNVYIGSSSRRWNEYVKSFIYYQYKKQYYFDLVKIMLSLRLINFFLMNLIVLKGNAVFIDNRKMFSVFLKFLKFETDHEILKEGWVSGTFTNFKEFQINKIYKNLNNEMLKKMGFYKLMRLPDVVITFSNYYN